MSKLQKSAGLTLGIGLASLVAILFCHLALTDIWHGETAVDLEWRIVQVGFAVIILFHAVALVTAYLALRTNSVAG